MHSARLFLSCLFVALICSAHAAAQIDYNERIQPIFNGSCISCHGAVLSGVTLSSYASVMASVGVQYGKKVIQPGSAATSPLYDKISNATPQHGQRMPRGGPALSSDQIAAIRTWIDEGAKERPSSSSAERVAPATPAKFALSQNYPNPFNPSTQISFSVATKSHVTLKIYDVIGHEAAVLADAEFVPGVYRVEWDASRFPSGVYFYQIEAGGSGNRAYIETRKLVVQK